ncbi:MAG: siderophore-interacting protein [Pseudomonas sp.]
MSASPYRLFDMRVARRIALTPSLLRIVFTGDSVAQMRSYGPDQRIKLFFPAADGGAPVLVDGPDWYAAYRAQPEATRPPMRTYTIRALRPARGELDVDFVLHGDTGPASRWAARARPGDPLLAWAPGEGCAADTAGYEWRPPAHARQVLIVADETALPAAAGILEELAERPQPPQVRALVEVPHAGDDAYPALHDGAFAPLHWLPRDQGRGDAAHGERLLEAVRALDLDGTRADAPQDLATVDVDRDILWERASTGAGGFYAWIAGEAGVVMRIRRHLLGERGIDKRAVTFMGYWRQGRALD